MSEEAELRELLNLRAKVDDIVERAQSGHATLASVLDELLPAVSAAVGARGMFLESYDEDRLMNVFRWPPKLEVPSWDTMSIATGEEAREVFKKKIGDVRVIAQPLDVAGTWFGRAGFVFDEHAPVTDDQAATKLDNVCEKLTRAGVRGLKGGVDRLATNRRARLVEYAVAVGLVTTGDLVDLDADGNDALTSFEGNES